MSDAERSNKGGDDTVVRSADDANTPDAKKPADSGRLADGGRPVDGGKPANEAANRPRLADRLMGRSGPRAEKPGSATGSTAYSSTGSPSSSEGKGSVQGASSPARPTTSKSDIQPTGSAASAVPAPLGASRGNTGDAASPQQDSNEQGPPTALSAGPVVGSGRPDFASGVPTTVSNEPREDLQVGVMKPRDRAAGPGDPEPTGVPVENATGQGSGEAESSSNRAILTEGRPSTRRTRKARLRLASVDPWSVMKMAFLFSMAAGIALVVAVTVVWFVVSQSGLFDSVNQAVNDALSAPGDSNSFDLARFVSGGRVIGSALLLAVIDVVLWTALATVGAFLYNLGATLLGGFEVTLADD